MLLLFVACVCVCVFKSIFYLYYIFQKYVGFSMFPVHKLENRRWWRLEENVGLVGKAEKQKS